MENLLDKISIILEIIVGLLFIGSSFNILIEVADSLKKVFAVAGMLIILFAVVRLMAL